MRPTVAPEMSEFQRGVGSALRRPGEGSDWRCAAVLILASLLRASRAIKATAWALVAAGVAAPVLRRRVKLPPAGVIAASALAPAALVVAMPRGRARDTGVCALNMWAYLAAYEMPHDDPQRLASRVRIDYPIDVDRGLGLGVGPTGGLHRPLPEPPPRGCTRCSIWALFSTGRFPPRRPGGRHARDASRKVTRPG